MSIQLKKISDQTVVITGATSGIGLVTARLAASRGANLLLIARNADALGRIAEELDPAGEKTIWAVADVADRSALEEAADKAIAQFGHIDTWINNAGVSIYGRNTEVSLEDQRRLFDTNYWGVVNGSLVAVKHLRQNGGAIINLGSELSDVAVPLQGAYSASKHAVKGFTDSLRVELAEENAPISVTLIKPAGVDTQFVLHAKNYMEVEPKLPAPVYAPAIAAEAILTAAQQPRRDIYVGAASKLISSTNKCAPPLLDIYLKNCMFSQQRTETPKTDDRNALHAPIPNASIRERGGATKVMPLSPYTFATSRAPMASRLAFLGIALALGRALTSRKRA